MSSSSQPNDPARAAAATPRLSASIVAINPRNQVLLVQRNARATFGGLHVFPGGNYDGRQDSSIHMTAVRETFEESGLLVAKSAQGQTDLHSVDLAQTRADIHSHKLLFKDFLQRHSLSVDSSHLLPFTQWITPAGAPKRFHTHFFVVFLPETGTTGFASGEKQDFIPTPDGGQEVISAKFLHVHEALKQFKEKRLAFMPPQYYILDTLSSILQGDKNTASEREQVEALARGAFGSMVINPTPLPGAVGADKLVLTYEGDEARGGRPGRLHRVNFKLNKGAVVTTDVELHRNFDLRTDIDWVQVSSKL